jgi:hypothetical protein
LSRPPYVLGNIVDRRTPYIYQWIFNIQRQLTNNISAEVGYQGNAGHKIERLRAYNEAILRTGPSDARPIEQRQPWPAYGRIQEVDGSVTSNYHAMNLKLQQRFAKGATYLLGYTWSKAIDNGSAIRVNDGDRLFPVNSYDIKAEHGLSQFHTGRRFIGSFIYELPFGMGKPLLNHVGVVNKMIGGWQVGSIITFSDGTPLGISGLGDRANTGNENIPDATGVSPVPSDQSAHRFWNLAAFDGANPALLYRFGNVGRNILFRPGVRQWDFSLTKNTSITESHILQFRFEAFNFSNHPNWNPPSSNVLSPSTFGVITSARTMRELQFGLKYIF